MKSAPRFLLFWIVALGGSPLRTAQAAAPAGAPGLTCTLTLADGKTQFQQGELVRLRLTFTSDRPGRYQISRWEPQSAEVYHVVPAEGTSDPFAEERGGPISIDGYIPPPETVGNKPVSMPLLLNEFVRFDRPGTYHLSVTSRRVFTGKSVDPLGSLSPQQDATTNSIEFQIVPQDLAWAHAQLQTALAEIADRSAKPLTLPDPWDVLTFLGAQESAQALLALLSTDKAPRSSDSEGRLCRPGLVAFPDRAWLIGEMGRDLVAPGYAVTQTFLDTLADMQAYRRKAADDAPDLRAAWRRAADAVPAKTASALPMTLHTLLETAWLDARVGTDPDVRARTPALKRRLAPIFDQLPPLPQEYLLGDEWGQMRGPALLPALRRLWARANRPADNDSGLNDLVLRRLYDLSPEKGRALIVKEIASPRPRATVAALGILPDRTLPLLDHALAANLADQRRGADVDTTCLLIARYATPAVFPQAQAFFRRQGSLTTTEPLLAYFLRVRPAFGRVALHRQLLSSLGRGSGETLLGDVARIGSSPLLEQIAVAALDNPDPGIAADAARTLGQHGSARSETALWSRLERTEAADRSRAAVEPSLVSALSTGQNWYVGPAQLRRIRALCVTPAGRQQMDDLQNRMAGRQVHVDYEVGDPGWWTIGQYTGKGAGAFFAKMAQFPRGTSFLWQEISFGPAEERLMTQASVITRARGMTLHRWKPMAKAGA